MMPPGYGFMDLGSYGWMMVGAMLFWLGVAAIVAYVVVRLARPAERREDARAILDARFARGEIDAEEHRTRRTHLAVR